MTAKTPEQRAEAAIASTDGACGICDWPLAASIEKGCVPGNCSYRPSDHSADRARVAERRVLAARVARAIREAEQATIERCAAVVEVVAEKLDRDHPDASPGYGAWCVRTHILTLAAQRRIDSDGGERA